MARSRRNEPMSCLTGRERRVASRRWIAAIAALFIFGAVATVSTARAQDSGAPVPSVGYDDTPVLPGTQWRVHDGRRPQPKTVKTGALQAPVTPPDDAVVLFDGRDLSGWTGRDGKAAWTVAGGAMRVNGTGDIESRRHFGSCQLHIEWATPAVVKGRGQGRGNSGIFLMGKYEVQVLDSYDNPTYPDGQAGAVYGQTPPDVNASRPPGEWQSYDIIFHAPQFENGELKRPAVVTVLHNGVLVQDHTRVLGATTHRKLPHYSEHPGTGPLRLQDHGNPVRFRNIWVRPLDAR